MAILIAFIAIGIYPFGERAVLIIDSYHQYAPFFSELYDKLKAGDSLFYSWNAGLGMNFWSVIAYYLASPLNILILFFPRTLLIEGFTLIIVLKIALSSLSAAWFLKQKYRADSLSAVTFALFYALSGWVLGYNWNIMWLDCVCLLPVILWGLERLIKQGKGLLYGISLGLCIACNYYISIMVCIFLVLYYIVIFAEQKTFDIRLFFRRGIKFAGYSILGAALSGVLLLPTYYALMATRSADSSFPSKVKWTSNALELLSQHFTAVEPTSLSGKPNLYCGILALFLIVLYIFHRGLSLRARILKVGLLAFMLVSCTLNYLDYIWHGFHFPNSLPNRFTFIYIFILLTMCYETFICIRKFKIWQYGLAFALSGTVIVLSTMNGWTDHPFYTYLSATVLICVYFILIIWYKVSWPRRKLIRWLLSIVLLIEVAGNAIFGLCANGSINRTNYNQDLALIGEVIDYMDEETDSVFYRTEVNKASGRNNTVWLGIRGFSYFSSTLSDALDVTVGKMGFFSSMNKFTYTGATTIADSIFGIKYLLDISSDLKVRSFEQVNEIEGKDIYENPYALSLGFMVNQQYLDWDTSSERPHQVLNDLVRKMSGIARPMYVLEEHGEPEGNGASVSEDSSRSYSYTREDGDENNVLFRLDLKETKSLYLYYEAANMKTLKVIKDGVTQSYSDTRGHIVEIGEVGPDNEVILEFVLDDSHDKGKIKLDVFSYNDDVFQQFYEHVSQDQWELEIFEPGHVKGSITASQDGVMFTSIPYDKGWAIYIDGEKAELESVEEALIAVSLTAGEYEIELKYTPQGFVAGLAISLVSLFVFIMIGLWHRRKYGDIS